jgi:TRAP-type C4-dicarboxylate transport system permease small subunit
MLNAVVIFLIVLYFSFFLIVAKFVISTIQHKEQMAALGVTANKIYVNFQEWRSSIHTFLCGIYEGFLTGGHTIIAVLVLLLAGSNFTIPNLINLLICIIFIFVVEFIMPWPYHKSMKDKMSLFY